MRALRMAVRGIDLPWCLLAILLLFPPGTIARAGSITLSANLTGDQVVPLPAHPSPGSGDATLILDDINKTLTTSVTFQGLTSPTVAKGREGFQASAWIEEGAAGSGTMDLHPLLTAPFGVTRGSFTDLWTGLTAHDIMLLETNQATISIYTNAYPGGEIRGQIILMVPEPPSLVPGTMAVAILFGVARFRRR